jgi:hypothetical protein
MNSRGAITVDYLFAFFLVSGFSLAILTFSTAMSMVEVVQYMTFASARNYFAGNISEPKQQEAAVRKFMQLKANPTVAPLLESGWFSVPEDSLIVRSRIWEIPDFKDYEPAPGDEDLFHGAVVTFHAHILNFQVPFFGSTKKSDATGGDEGFVTNISSFLGREPSFEECAEFNRARWEKIKQLTNKSGAASYSEAQNDSAYVYINDNGC